MLARIRKAQEEKEGGFTLIELLVVIIIIGILAAIAIPVFLNQRKKGYDAQTKADLRNLGTLEETYLNDYNSYAGSTTAALATTLLPDYRATTNIKVNVVANGSQGFCMAGDNSQNPGKAWYYDSSSGGLQGSTPTCNVAGLTAPAAP